MQRRFTATDALCGGVRRTSCEQVPSCAALRPLDILCVASGCGLQQALRRRKATAAKRCCWQDKRPSSSARVYQQPNGLTTRGVALAASVPDTLAFRNLTHASDTRDSLDPSHGSVEPFQWREPTSPKQRLPQSKAGPRAGRKGRSTIRTPPTRMCCQAPTSWAAWW